VSDRPRARIALALAVVLLALVAVVGGPRPAPTPPSGAVDPPSPAVDDPLRVPFSDAFEPFDYRPAPPLARTPIDGYYLRIVTLEELGGPVVGMPVHCRRCVPFEIDPGIETLTLHSGRYFLDHQLTGRRGLGHYRVRGDVVRFFNDPNCSRTVGAYRWHRRARTLVLEAVRDPCPFGATPETLDHRARDLTYSAWAAVRVCTSQIRVWWPALFACADPGSRSS
jgi:hypothetical protein